MTSAIRKLKQPFNIVRPTMFDTHRYIKFLKSKGIKEPQAESIVQVVSESREFDMAKVATKEQLDKFESYTKERFDKIEMEMKDLRKEIRSVLFWVVGITISGLAATAAILAFVLPILINKPQLHATSSTDKTLAPASCQTTDGTRVIPKRLV